ncbi:hypothetical protein ABIE18_000111 [Arthrobacter sp. 2762]
MAITAAIDVVVSPALPIVPTLAQDAVRMVRHGLADILEWLGEDVGPQPGEETHIIASGGKLLVSQKGYDYLLATRGVGGSGSLQIQASLTPAR